MLRSMITARARPGTLIVGLALYGIAAEVMFGPWPGLVARVREKCAGLGALDVRGFWSAQDAQALVLACGAGGRDAYIDLQLADLFYPAISGAILVLVSAALLHRYGPRLWPLLLPAIAMTALDYTENAAVWTLLVRWPQVDEMVAAVGGPASAMKQALGFVAFSLVIVLLAIAAVRSARLGRSIPCGRSAGPVGVDTPAIRTGPIRPPHPGPGGRPTGSPWS